MSIHNSLVKVCVTTKQMKKPIELLREMLSMCKGDMEMMTKIEEVIESIERRDNYGIFCMAMAMGGDSENLDQWWEDADRNYCEFVVSEWNDPYKSELDCIHSFVSRIKKVTDVNRIVGTSWGGHTVYATANELIKVLGKPSMVHNDGKDKSNLEWWIEIGNNVFTVYDWKEYRIIGMDDKIEWHVGGKEYVTFAINTIENLLSAYRKEVTNA